MNIPACRMWAVQTLTGNCAERQKFKLAGQVAAEAPAADSTPVAEHRGGLFTMSPDGRVLATLGTDGDLTLWDTTTWRPYGKPVVDEQAWGFIHFPDAESVQVLFDTGRRVRLSVDREEWVAAACSAANRNLTADEAAIVLPGQG